MTIIDDTYVETISGKYAEGYALDEYKGEIAIVVAREWEGKVFTQWVYRQIGKKDEKRPADKAFPMGIFLGNRNMAIKRLLEMAVSLGWQPKAGTILPSMGHQEQAPKEQDIPF